MASGVFLAAGWLLLLLLLGFIGLPIAARLFSDHPKLGVPFALPMSLAVFAIVTFWLGRLSFPAAPWIAVVVVGSVSIGLKFRQSGSSRYRSFLAPAIVFVVGFLLILGIRSITPAITPSGEAFWNFGLIQSLLRTGQLPPQDPWFAGEPVRYYYGGHLLIAALAELTNTPGRFAYNLGKAVFYATLLTSAYGVAHAIAVYRELPSRSAGLLGVFMVGLAGTLHTPVWGALKLFPPSVASPFVTAVGIDPAIVTPSTSFSTFHAAHFTFTNTDFPIYTVFIGGVHPHNFSPPFMLLLTGLMVAYFYTPTDARSRRRSLLTVSTPVIGLIAVMNTWSLPTAIGLVTLTVILTPAHPLSLAIESDRLERLSDRECWSARVLVGTVVGLVVGSIGILWVFPYFFRGLAGDPSLSLLPPRSNVWFFVYGFGGFLVIFAAYLGLELSDLAWSRRSRTIAVLSGTVLVGIGWLVDFPGLFIVGPILLGGLGLHFTDRSDFTPVLIIAGAGLALLIELAYVKESAEVGRINTVYKVFMQIWVLWGPAAGVALRRVAGDRPPELTVPGWRPAFATIVVVLLSLYTVAGLGGYASIAVEHDIQYSLDGLAYLNTVYPDYGTAIAWLAAHPGQPTIASAPVPEYRLYEINASPAASLTGIPTIVGWNHEADYRGESEYRERVRAVDLIYAGSNVERARTLREYNVSYIWVGQGEATRYRTIDYSREQGISTVFQEGNITIYAVNRSNLLPE